ncbi:MAG: ribosome silencing factor [Desulfobacterales bacterium]|nr:ribosome silencing factor [Desulfobacterales bacterium]
MTEDPHISPRREFDLYIKAAQGRKAFDLVLLYVRELSSVADAFLICSGRSHRQVTAIGEYIRTDLKKHGIKPLSVEGVRDGQWVLLDYGDVIIHVFYEPVREFYDLEGLWIDAERIEIEDAPNGTDSPDP